MKSKRAKQYLDSHTQCPQNPQEPLVRKERAIEALAIAERVSRKIAAKAYKRRCVLYDEGRCMCSGRCNDECGNVMEFLMEYDELMSGKP